MIKKQPISFDKIRDDHTLNAFFFSEIKVEDFDNPNKINLDKVYDAGFFNKVEGKIIHSDGSYRYHTWPAGDYLKEILKFSPTRTTQERISQIISELDPQGNPWAAKPLVDMACVLPPELSATLIPRASMWIPALKKLPIDFCMEDWVKYLIDSAFYKDALTLAKVTMDEGYLDKLNADTFEFQDSIWHINKAVDAFFPKLAKFLPEDTFDYTSNTLEKIIKVYCKSRNIDVANEPGYTYNWKQPGSILVKDDSRDVIAVFIDALAQVVRDIKEDNSELYRDYLQQLADSKWESFRRVALACLMLEPNNLFSDLREKLKETSHRDKPERAMRVIRVNHKPPLSDEKLQKMPWEEVVEFLLTKANEYPENSWDNNVPDRQGLRGAIQARVSKDPQAFFDNWRVIEALPIEELETFIEGAVGELGESPLPADNKQVTAFLTWFLKERYPSMDDALKSRSSMSIVRLIRRRFLTADMPPLEIPSEIERLLNEFITNPPYEEVREEERLSAKPESVVDFAINTSHGEALDVLFDGVFKAGQSWKEFKLRKDFERIKAYAAEVSLSRRPSQIYILAQNLSNFLSLDAQWSMQILAKNLFEKKNPVSYQAAKIGFLRMHQVSSEMLPYYKDWVAELGQLPLNFEASNWEPERFLVGHIMYYHIQGTDILQQGSVGYDLFTHAPVAIRRKAISRLQQFLSPEEGSKDATDEAYSRAKEIINWRRESQAEYQEFRGILSWISGVLESDTTWAYQQLLQLLSLAKDVAAKEGENDTLSHFRERILYLLQKAPKTEEAKLFELVYGLVLLGKPKWIHTDYLINLIEPYQSKPSYRVKLNMLATKMISYGFLEFKPYLH